MALTDLPTLVVDLEPPSERRSLGLPPWLRRFLSIAADCGANCNECYREIMLI